MNRDYTKPVQETEGSERAWRTGALKVTLGIFVREYGEKEVRNCLNEITKI